MNARRVVVNVNKMAEPGSPLELQRVLPEYRDIYREIFHDDDSDEFDGFDEEDIEDGNDDRDTFSEESWTVGGLRPSTFTFTGNAGVRLPVPDDGHLSFLDYFGAIISDDIINIISFETNRYAEQYFQKHPVIGLHTHSRFSGWKDTTPGEIRVFLAMTIAMGIVKQLDIQDYWSTDPVISTPFFKTVMPRDRFLVLMSFLHLSDNSAAIERGNAGYSPLQKLGVPYRQIIHNFSAVYKPSSNIAVDEGMIPWRGNLHFRVYNPDKPCKYGLKMYMLCDSKNGYCCQVELYTGKDGQVVSEFGRTYDLVVRLITPYLNQGYCVYMDNYFSSPHLFYFLYLNATLACGTLRTNRKGVPRQLKEMRVAKGDIYTMNNSTLVLVKYADKKDVTLLTTAHEGVMMNSGRVGEDGLPISKPDCVIGYNKNMGAVDRCDQMVVNGIFERRTLKWWKKVFFHTVGLAVVNSYLLYKHQTPNAVQQRTYRRELVSQLIQTAEVSGPPQRGRKRPAAEVMQRLHGRHFPSHLPPTNKRQCAKRRCVVCGPAEMEIFKSSNPGVPVPNRTGRETTYECRQCKVALCVDPCFEIFHTKAEYILAYKRLKAASAMED